MCRVIPTSSHHRRNEHYHGPCTLQCKGGRAGWARDYDVEPVGVVVDNVDAKVIVWDEMKVSTKTDTNVSILADT